MPVRRGTPGKSSSRGVFALVRGVLAGRETTADVRTRLKGYRGESQVVKALRDVPEGWRIFHNVGLKDETIDYVVTGPRGVFNIEVSVESGTVVANNRGLYTNGRRNNRLVERAMRQSGELEKRLRVEVKPVLAIVGADLTGNEVDGLPVFLLDDLTRFLLNDDGRRLSWEAAKPVLATLEAMTR